jgi:hypothetical protein
VAAALAGLLCTLAAGLAAAAEAVDWPPARSPGLSAPAPRPADPADARTPVPALTHNTSFGRRAAPAAPPIGDWRAANERVRAVGGWRTYLKEAQP